MGREVRTRFDVAAENVRIAARRRAVGGGPAAAAEEAAGAAPGAGEDGFIDRLVKYIPAEVIAVYLPIQAQILAMNDAEFPRLKWGFLWAVFLLLIPGTALYLRRFQNVTKTVQLAISAAAFVVWVIGTGGGPLLMWAEYKEPLIQFGPLLVPLFTFTAALIEPRPPAPA